jgi:hypothetical protein
VLTPLPKTVPTDGSTISVYVDSVPVGNLATAPNVYNQHRSDVAGNFPGLNNTSGPVGAYFLDTTRYENGVHTIFWIAYDDAEAGDGIGSRYFNILNTSGAPVTPDPSREIQNSLIPSKIGDLGRIPAVYLPVRVNTGFDLKAAPGEILPDRNGVYHIEIQEINRVEIDLGDERVTRLPLPGRSRYSGYLVVGDELRRLPIGATLHPLSGCFAWMPGPGFVGSYGLIFVRSGAQSPLHAYKVRIEITPKR